MIIETLGIVPATKPLHHVMKQAALEYECNQVVAFAGLNAVLQRKPGSAFARLDVFQSNELGRLVFIVTEPPDDLGLSITSCADGVAAMGLGHLFVGDEKGRPVNPQMVYIEHYPESLYKESFSIVTFTPAGTSIEGCCEVSAYHNPTTGLRATWIRLDRAQVEQLIGQEFVPREGEENRTQQKVG